MRIRARIQRAKPMRFHADPDPGQTISTQINLYMENLLYAGPTYLGTDAFQKGWNSSLFVNFVQFPGSWIRIRIAKTDPDPQHCFMAMIAESLQKACHSSKLQVHRNPVQYPFLL